MIQIVGKEIDDEYLRQVHTLSIDPEVIQRQKDLKIVYTPIHGTGMTLIPQSLRRAATSLQWYLRTRKMQKH